LIRYGRDIWDSIINSRENINIGHFYNQMNEELRIIEEEAEKVLINQAELENLELEEEGKYYRKGQFILGGERADKSGIYKKK
jgi:hypothetical protein